ncbi:tRNA-splicing endonuclease subunit Sen34 [Alosa sapidissima]|uniref:tRNA-splicing endonuclease subunit Sen34 n=1 Tax=Alosa sapidissima TaxID=34773 RepID=UPI001C0955D3|nr:tRNA-splicing endonuclease subunit Sen34 [Alosa sapidissima]
MDVSDGVTQMDLTNGKKRMDTVDSGDCVTSAMGVSHVSEKDPLAGIRMCGSTPLLWRVADLKIARQAGVIGSLVGSLARQPRQNTRLGRPLELLDEEARLLAEEGKAKVLVARNVEIAKDHSERVEQYQEDLERSHKVQSALALQDRKAVLERVMNDSQNEGTVRERLEALDRDFSLPVSAMTIQMCTARAGLGYLSDERDFLAASWPVQQDERSQTKFVVYRDLRRRGFCLTSAGKFGGDYLVYPGDPLRFHAHFIALCVAMDTATPLCDILAMARLGSNVKKTVVLCSPRATQQQSNEKEQEEKEDEDDEEEREEGGDDYEEEEDEVVYTSLQWSGMS